MATINFGRAERQQSRDAQASSLLGCSMADPWEIVQYDVKAFPFARIVRQMIGVRDLTCLPKASAVATRESDQQTAYHSKFYQNLEAFLPTYRRLLCHLFDEGLDRVYFQRVPTFRVHMRGSVAVGAWHRDRDYGHDSSEVKQVQGRK